MHSIAWCIARWYSLCCDEHDLKLLSVDCFLQPLSVELGPGILNNIFDGIQRPLKQIAVASGDVFIPRGVSVPALDASKSWEFHPTGFKVSTRVVSGACSGTGN